VRRPMEDALLSIRESLKHAGIEAGVKPEITWVDSEALEEGAPELMLRDVDGILVPGGFGSRAQKEVKAVTFARERKIPFLESALGCSLQSSSSPGTSAAWREPTALSSGQRPSRDRSLAEQEKIRQMGATMRLGNYPAT